MIGKPNLSTQQLVDLFLSRQFSRIFKEKFEFTHQTLSEAKVTLLYSYEDQNFKVYLPKTGTTYFVKIQNLENLQTDLELAEQADQIIHEFINFWDFELSQKILFSHKIEAKVPIQGSGNERPGSSVGASSACLLKICNWVPGQNLASFVNFEHENLGEMIEQCMKILKNWHVASKKFSRNRDLSALKNLQRAWDLEKWVEISRKAGHFELLNKSEAAINSDYDNNESNIEICSIIQNLAHEYQTKFYPKFQESKAKILIHQDLNPNNILVDEDLKITGIIDYNNAIVSWAIIDVAEFVACFFCQMTKYLPENTSEEKLLANFKFLIDLAFDSYQPDSSDFDKSELLFLVKCAMAQAILNLSEAAEIQQENSEQFRNSIVRFKKSLKIVSRKG